LIFGQFFPDDDLQATVFQLRVEDFVFIGHLRGHRDARRADDPNGSVSYLHLHPCCQLILLFEDFLQLTLYLRQGREKRGQLPRVVFNGVKVILILVVSGVVLRRALDFFVQLPAVKSSDEFAKEKTLLVKKTRRVTIINVISCEFSILD